MTEHTPETRDKLNGTYVFDGYCHRPFEEQLDGWRRTQIAPGEYTVVDIANQIVDMAMEINRLRRENWELVKNRGVRDAMWQQGFPLGEIK